MATIDTSWHPVAVPDTGGSAFLSYSSALRDSANKLLENVVSQRQKETEMQNAKEAAQLELALKDASLQEQIRQNNLADALGRDKLAADIFGKQLEYDLGLRKIDAIIAKAAASKGSSGGSLLNGSVLNAILNAGKFGAVETTDIEKGLTDSGRKYFGKLMNDKYSTDPDVQNFQTLKDSLQYLPQDVAKEVTAKINSMDNDAWLTFDSTKVRNLARVLNNAIEGHSKEIRANASRWAQYKQNQEAMEALPALYLRMMLGGGVDQTDASAPASTATSTAEDDWLLGTRSNNNILGDNLI